MPYEDRRALRAVIRFIGEYAPDRVIQIGDLADFPQPSRWSKGSAAEFEGSVFRDAEHIKRTFLKPLRDVYAGPIGVHEGNHDLRPRVYLARYAPALAESGAFDMDVLLDLKAFDVELLPDFHPVAPGWVTTHGHLGGITLSRIAGNTALNGAKKTGVSLVMGHTHRQGIGSHTTGYGGRVSRTLTGVEVGHLMDMRQAQYLDGATANWQAGFAVLHIDGEHVHPELVPITKRRFVVDGVTYAA